MVTTRGFRDVIEIRRGTKDDLWDAYKDVAPPYVRRRDRFEVTERIDYAGEVLDAARRGRGARAWPRILRRRGVETVAVCFINAYANPANELRDARDPRGGAAGRERRPRRARCCRRSSSTSASRPPSPTPCCRRSSAATCGGSSERLEDGGYDGDLLLLHSGGGVMTPRTVERLRRAPRRLRHRRGRDRVPPPRRRCAAIENAIGLDMGGTSHRHLARLRRRAAHHERVVRRVRLPDLLPDASRCSRSAPAAARWRGSTRPARCATARSRRAPIPARPATAAAAGADQHRRQRRARPPRRRAGRRRMHARPRAAAERAIRERRGRAAAARRRRTRPSAMLTVANANMADAVRLISIRRGYDPRDFALVAFGGAGPLHGAALAQGAVDPDRARAAQPGHHLGARLPAGRRPPRPVRDVPAARRRRPTRRRSRREFASSRTRRASA